MINPSSSFANNKRADPATSFVVIIFPFHVSFWGELWKTRSDFGPASGGGVAMAQEPVSRVGMVAENMGPPWVGVD